MQQADRDVPQGRHDLGPSPGVAGVLVFPPGGITQPVHRFNGPLAPGDLGEDLGGAALRVQAGDAVDDLLGQVRAGDVVGVAADPVHLVRVREVDSGGTGDPDGPQDDPPVAAVEVSVVGLGAAVLGDLVVDVPLEAWLVAFHGHGVVGVPAAVFFLPRNVFRGVALGVGRVGGHDAVHQVDSVQQLFDLGDLVSALGDAVLADDDLLVVQHRGEQLLGAVGDAAQPLAVDRDRGQQRLQLPGLRQRPQPAADDLVQAPGVDGLDEGADPLLAGSDDRALERVDAAAEAGEHVLRQVRGLVADLPVGLRPGQRTARRDRQDEHQLVAAAPPFTQVRDLRQHFQQPRDFLLVTVFAGHGGLGGMRHWHGRPLVPGRSGVWLPRSSRTGGRRPRISPARPRLSPARLRRQTGHPCTGDDAPP